MPRRSAALALLALAVLAVGCATRPGGRTVAVGPRSPEAPFSPAVAAGGLVFLSGQLGLAPGTREPVPGGIAAETAQALANVRALLEEVGLGMGDVVKCTVFLADMADYAAMNDVYRAAFPGDPPARSTVAVAGLALGAAIEVECIAAAR